MTREKLEKYVDDAYKDGNDIQDFIDEYEVIYYGEALELFAEIDPSFTLAAELLSEYNYNVKDINSERMATLVARDYMEEYAKEQGYIKSE